MITVWPQTCDSFSPSMRAAMSVAPPGANGTMKRTGFCGQDCAWAAKARSGAKASVSVLMPCPPKKILQRQRESQADGDGERAGERRQALLPLVPVEKLDGQNTQAAPEVRR